MKQYAVNEVFYSLQGEGARAGTPNVFVRFSGCNLACSKAVEGFDCDTEFAGARKMSASELVAEAKALVLAHASAAQLSSVGVIFTGGEPTLQLDEELVQAFNDELFFPCLETNGLRPAPQGLAWISCSPKTAEHTLQVERVNELRYVRARGQALPKPKLEAKYLFLSPAFSDNPAEFKANVAWCIQLCKENPAWSLSLQQHKLWAVR